MLGILRAYYKEEEPYLIEFRMLWHSPWGRSYNGTMKLFVCSFGSEESEYSFRTG